MTGTWLKWRPGGATREMGDNWLGRSESEYVASRHLQCCSPRLCRLKTVWLAPACKYWTYRSHADDMGPVNLVVGHRQELDLRPLLHWLVRKRSWVRTHESISRRAVDCVGSPFSREQWDLSKSVGVSRKVVTYGDHPQEAYAGHTWTGMGSVRVVLSGFPYRVYIDSNHRDSRIWVTACLWQSSRS
jgi:hypothetical protein